MKKMYKKLSDMQGVPRLSDHRKRSFINLTPKQRAKLLRLSFTALEAVSLVLSIVAKIKELFM